MWTTTIITAWTTILIQRQQITAPIRNAITKRIKPNGQLAYLVGCYWCLSTWIAAGTATIVEWGDIQRIITAACTAATLFPVALALADALEAKWQAETINRRVTKDI